MAKEKTNLKQELPWKRKRWFQLLAPEAFGKGMIGETLVLDAKELAGKTLTLSMMALTGDIRRQNLWVKFRVIKTQDNKAETEVVGYEMSPSSIKRFVRRRRDRVDSSFVCRTKDGRPVRLKPLLITAYQSSNSVTTSLRKHSVDFLVREVVKMSYDELIRLIISGQLERKFRDTIRTICPLKMAAIRKLEAVDEKRVRVIEVTGGKQERVNQSEEVAESSEVAQPEELPVSEEASEELVPETPQESDEALEATASEEFSDSEEEQQ